MEDGKHVGFTEIGVGHLHRSVMERINLDAANVLNTAFTTNSFDGTPFISNAHPGAGGTTYNNLITGNPALSQSSVENALTVIMSAKDATGRAVTLNADKLVVPPALWPNAATILASAGRTGTANNDNNPIEVYGHLRRDPALLRRLTSSSAWFMFTKGGDSHAIVYAERIALGLDNLPDFDTGSMRHRARVRYAMVPENPLGVFGSTGAGA